MTREEFESLAESAEWEETIIHYDTIYNFSEPYEVLTGQYMGMIAGAGKFTSNLYVIKSKGISYGLWGSAVLDKLLESVDVGRDIAIMYEGVKAAADNTGEYKMYKVLVKKSVSSPVK